jgi:secreted effector protein SseB
MSSVTAVHTQDLAPMRAVGSPAATGVQQQAATDQVFGPGLGVLQLYMRMLSQLASDHQQQMKAHGEIANEAQKMVSVVDALIAEIDSKEKPGGKVKWSPELINYVKSHPEWHQEIGFNGNPGDSNKKDFTTVRGIIQKYATQESNITSQVQLQVQKTMQTYNVTIGLMNSLQTMLGDMTKQFAQAIR